MTRVSEYDFVRALAAFEAAMFEPELWAEALALFGRAAGGWAAQLVAADQKGAVAFDLAAGLDEAMLREWERLGGMAPGLNPRARSLDESPFAVVTDADVASARQQHPQFVHLVCQQLYL